MDSSDRYRGRVDRLTGAYRPRRSSWPPQHEPEQVLDARNNQPGWRCVHCRTWMREYFQGACQARIRAIRAAIRRRRSAQDQGGYGR